MKDFSEYSNADLFGMLNHLNFYKYPEKVAAVESEIEMRRTEGRIPSEMIPAINWRDLKMKGNEFRIFGTIQMLLALVLFAILTINIQSTFFTENGFELQPIHINTILLLVSLVSLILGGLFLMMMKNRVGALVSLPGYLLQIITFQLANIKYQLMVLVGVFVTIGSDGVGFAFKLSTYEGVLELSQNSSEWLIGVNLVGVVLAGIMVILLFQKKKN